MICGSTGSLAASCRPEAPTRPVIFSSPSAVGCWPCAHAPCALRCVPYAVRSAADSDAAWCPSPSCAFDSILPRPLPRTPVPAASDAVAVCRLLTSAATLSLE